MTKISECTGLWLKCMTEEEISDIENNIKERRRSSRKAKEEKAI